MKKAVIRLFAILIIIAVSGCSPVLPGSNKQEPPAIKMFTVSPQEISAGKSATLNWEVSGNPGTVTIEPGVGSVAMAGSASIAPLKKQQYIITATNQFGTASSEVTLDVKEDFSQVPSSPPVINSFTAQPSAVPVGALVELKWDVENADTVSIQWGENSRLDLKENRSSIVQQPVISTSYILVAKNNKGTKTVITSVTIKADPPASASGGTVAGCG